MMDELLEFDPEDQRNVHEVAGEVYLKIKNRLPRFPWLSHFGQQDAFKETVKLAIQTIEEINANIDAKNAILFWTLCELYLNNRKFTIATESIRRVGEFVNSRVAMTWIECLGNGIPPGIIVAKSVSSWR